MIKNNLKIFISATEQSGDNIGYHLIKEILKTNDQITFEGVGGKKMSSYLNTQFFSLKDFNTMGIFEVLFSIRKFIKMIKYLANIIKNNNYDLVITIDSPDFNYPLVKEIRKNKYNKKIIHIVAPTVWAWRKYRAKNFAKIYNELLVLFEFEIKYFVKHGLKTNLIGHPIYYIEKNKNFFKKNKKERNLLTKINPLKTIPTSKDTAMLVEFLTSDKSKMINGESISVDGGLNLYGQEELIKKLLFK